MAKDKTLPAVPESILKKRKRVNEAKAQALKAKNLTKLEKQEKRTQYFKRAEKYVQEYLAAEAEENRSVLLLFCQPFFHFLYGHLFSKIYK